MWAVILFILAFSGILILTVFKNWERRNGVEGTRALRSRFDAELIELGAAVRAFPHRVKFFAVEISKRLVIEASSATLHLLRFVEYKLIRVINLVKGKQQISDDKATVSYFLQNVSTYKEEHPVQ